MDIQVESLRCHSPVAREMDGDYSEMTKLKKYKMEREKKNRRNESIDGSSRIGKHVSRDG